MFRTLLSHLPQGRSAVHAGLPVWQKALRVWNLYRDILKPACTAADEAGASACLP